MNSRRRPSGLIDLFVTFSLIGIQSFGGAIAIVQREILDNRQWFSKEEFVEMLTVAQSLPGPNAQILSIMIGDRFFGLRGAAAAGLGLISLPLCVLTACVLAYRGAGDIAWVWGALHGVAIVAAGMVTGSAVRLTFSARHFPIGAAAWAVIALAVFGLVALLKTPLVWALLLTGIPSICAVIPALRRKQMKDKEAA